MVRRLFIRYYGCFYHLIILITSCSSPPSAEELSTMVIPDRIDTELYLTDLSSSISQIQLETNEHALLGVIKDVKFYNDKFYINDGNQILVFDNKGNFLTKLGGQGGGPGEYGIVYSMSVDYYSNLIYVSSVRKLLVFSRDHRLVKEKKYPMLLPYLKVVDNRVLIVSDEIVGDFENEFVNNTTLYEVGSDLLVKDSSIVRKVIVDEDRAIGYNFKFFISSNQSGSYFYKPVLTQESIFPDTLYQIIGVKLIPYKKIDFEKLQTLSSDGIVTPLMVNVVNSFSYIICEYMQDGERRLFLFDKTKLKGYNLKGGILDSENDPVVLRPLDLSNDVFYYTKSPEYTSAAIEEVNPIIGIVKLK